MTPLLSKLQEIYRTPPRTSATLLNIPDLLLAIGRL
jgi:hypothetical protein